MHKIMVTLLFAGFAYGSAAQDLPPLEALPALPGETLMSEPDMPTPPENSFDPTNPFTSNEPVIPIAPIEEPLPEGMAPTDLPALQSEDDFDFFQPGAQIGDFASEEEPVSLPVQEQAEEAPKPKKRRVRTRFSKRFNYKIQQLPEAIYKKSYRPENRHLPQARYQQDYDAATFYAAAQNDLNAVRSMLEYGGRSLFMRNTRGETLVAVAARHRAHAVLRYLLAKGAPRDGGYQYEQDVQNYYALRAGR